jgi:CheY-like chemotaxis protein
MAKIMLVEDDNNLREIYEARLLAEGYEIVSAKDGEEALAMVVKERPDLIISDVMMPKISGFDMLDIIRSTPETRDTKVIMMTALSQAEDKARADKLGADRYLVKSQVTLEDVAKVAREVLAGQPATPVGGTSSSDDTPPAAPTPAPVDPPAEPTVPPTTDPPAPVPAPEPPVSTPPIPTDPPQLPVVDPAAAVTPAQTTADEEATVKDQIENFISTQEPAPTTEVLPPTPEPAAVPVPVVAETAPAKPEEQPSNDSSPVMGKKIIQPLNDLSKAAPDLGALLDKEEASAAPHAAPPTTVISPNGTSVTPVATGASADVTVPGNVVKPSSDPNQIAL